ncbi:MAG: phenylacetic acid degradation protein PaaY [Alcanivorax sp.]|nr:phenylacetic acid degradation protein PaaY [Alcanivorax sp.]MAY08956.1 phenylacetic acid degradation protein PaaY [Alcanivorax sp.]MBI52844.1 phenylacetic acid degradation protein PaaY [Alcanivorax sp.]MBU58510.1 phenylacetic acid degradation protein PaaY [Alcanivorax sp.]HCE41636.1 phenylacetic acid degradation protein PaaY [Alcanivorax sp.]|tara:strand:+ start:4371 stop:4973 length:603 start_codon:yes stop_codon:yes gene_type:complete
MPCYQLEGITPVIHPDAYVDPTAVLIGDVIVGPDCYVGPCASLRGDFGRLILERGANLQDTCVMHGFPGTDTIVEQDGHIGHGAVLHGCRIGRNAMVGMNAVILDYAEIGESSIVAAGALVKGRFNCPPRSMVIGAPAVVKRELSEEEVRWKYEGTLEYQELARRYQRAMKPCDPLTEMEANRPRMQTNKIAPKGEKAAG